MNHIICLQSRIESIAETSSKPGPAELGLDDTLAHLTLVGRRRVDMLLERVLAFSNDDDERAAAAHIQERTARVWHGGQAGHSSDDASERLQGSPGPKRV
ncbi:MAG TPA: hypothetical protein VIL09_15745 [Microvirga sp.]